MKVVALVGVALLSSSFTISAARAAEADPFTWLEAPQDPVAQNWVAGQNQLTLNTLTNDARFAPTKALFKELLTAQDRLPSPTLQGEYVYNFWQDKEHVRGVWRRVKLAEYELMQIPWETLIDLDHLAAQEQENWVWSRFSCLEPEYQHCLISLSHGGKDAVVTREFDLRSKSFIAAGFALPEAKSQTQWIDADTLFVSTDWGPGTMTASGYPAQVRLWRRGTAWQDAALVYAGALSSESATGIKYFSGGGSVQVVTESLDAFSAKHYLRLSDGTLELLPIPLDAEITDYFEGHLILRLRSNWERGGRLFTGGSLVAYAPEGMQATEIYAPGPDSAVVSVHTTSKQLLVSTLYRASSELRAFSFRDKSWSSNFIALPGRGSAKVIGSDSFAPTALFSFENFLVPPAIYSLKSDQPSEQPKLLRSAPARFAADPFVFEQYLARSRDGTRVPYWLVHAKNITLNGKNPTLLYAYGGFEVSMTPAYSPGIGKAWLEKGGVYVLANIRGGGEFGPLWHQAAIKRDRQRAFDDFIAVAEDLISRKVTEPAHLGIKGGSNGGLLVGTVATERPDLYKAVLCGVPLLDMVRYPLIAAGASWQGEYGDPTVPEDLAAILAYSPYQNLKAGAQYPPIFFVTSTFDDRVGPGHARKMAAKMATNGQPYYFFESAEGGHATPASADDAARGSALDYTYLYRQLMAPASF